MNILVTGAGGQVGHELVRRATTGEAVGLDRAALDITDVDAIAAAFAAHQPRVVINAAAYTAVDKAENESAAAFAINRDGAAILARACAGAGIPLLHLSTDYVFDGTRLDAYPVDAPAHPLGVYGQSKWEGEQAIRNSLDRHLILRVSWVFGAHGNNFVRTMLRLGRERDELRIVADQRGAPTHAAAIAETLLTLARRHAAGERLMWGTYHYTGTPVTSWHDFAGSIFDEAFDLALISRKPRVAAIATAEYPTPARRPMNSMLDLTASVSALGIDPADWRQGLREVLTEWKRAAA